MAIQTLDLSRFTNNEHFTVIELVLHTVSAATLSNRMAARRIGGLRKAFNAEGDAFKALHKKFDKNDLNEIDRQLCDKSEYSLQMEKLFRMCADEALLEAVEQSRAVRAATDSAYRQVVEILNALLVVSPNDELKHVETQLNQQAEYVEYTYQGGKHAKKGSGTAPGNLSLASQEDDQDGGKLPFERNSFEQKLERPAEVKADESEAQVRLMTIPLSQKLKEG